MSQKALSCFGFVSGKHLEKRQVPVISTQNKITTWSCTDHQLLFVNPVISHLSTAKLQGFFVFSEPNFKLRQFRFNANTHVERCFECFGNVSGDFHWSFFKQILIALLSPTFSPTRHSSGGE